MFKKAITFLLIFAMLVPFTAAAAADEPSATPTVEEILSEYHRKAFEAQTQGDSDSASTWSRRSNDGKTLEQETVDTLTEAGYEAYNVTADNYDTLEAELKTDFAAMGLDPEGSYIVVIHGEENIPNNQDNENGIAPCSVPEMEQEDFLGDSTFSYRYNGTVYWMRYLTVTAADRPQYSLYQEYDLIQNESNVDVIENALNSFIGMFLDESAPGQYWGTLLSIFGGSFIDFEQPRSTTLTLEVRVNWTRQYTQVYDFSTDEWEYALFVEKARIATAVECNRYNPDNDAMEEFQSPDYVEELFSTHYDNTQWRIDGAAQSFVQGGDPWPDHVGAFGICYIEPETGRELLIFGFNLE